MTDTLSPGGLGISVVSDGTNSVSSTREMVFTGATVTDGGKGTGRVNVDVTASSGNVTGPSSATMGHLAVFADTTGKVIEDGGAVPSGGGAVLSTGKITLSSAQLLALATNPITIIAAPGTDKAIQVLSSFYHLTFGTIQYATTDLTIGLYYSPAADGFPADAANMTPGGVNTFLQSDTESGMQAGLSGQPMGTYDNAHVNNVAVILSSQLANMTAGDGTGSITVLYSIIDL